MSWTPTRLGWAVFGFDPERDGTQIGLPAVRVPVRRIVPASIDHARAAPDRWLLEEHHHGQWHGVAASPDLAALRGVTMRDSC